MKGDLWVIILIMGIILVLIVIWFDGVYSSLSRIATAMEKMNTALEKISKEKSK